MADIDSSALTTTLCRSGTSPDRRRRRHRQRQRQRNHRRHGRADQRGAGGPRLYRHTSVRSNFRRRFTENGAPVTTADADTAITDHRQQRRSFRHDHAVERAERRSAQGDRPLPGGVTGGDIPVAACSRSAARPRWTNTTPRCGGPRYSSSQRHHGTADRLNEVATSDGRQRHRLTAALISVEAVNDAPAITWIRRRACENVAEDTALPIAGVSPTWTTSSSTRSRSLTAGSFHGDGGILTVDGAASGTRERHHVHREPDAHALVLTGTSRRRSTRRWRAVDL